MRTRSGTRDSYVVKIDTTIIAGSVVALDGGFAVPATNSPGLVVVGVSLGTVTGDGQKTVSVAATCVLLNNSEVAPITLADHINELCFIQDDGAVAHTTSESIAVGRVRNVCPDGVWVQI